MNPPCRTCRSRVPNAGASPARRRPSNPFRAFLPALLLLLVASAVSAAVPPVPSQPSIACDVVVNDECYVGGPFAISATSSGADHYKICRSRDTTGWGGCYTAVTTYTGSTYTVSGSHLPSDGFRRAYYFKACDAADNCTVYADNQEAYARMDSTPPTVPGPSAVDCAYSSGGDCWVTGTFALSAPPSTDTGSSQSTVLYDFCRSDDSTGGAVSCQKVMPLTIFAPILGPNYDVPPSHLPSPGYRRVYWVRGRDLVGNVSAWNTPISVRVDAADPTVSADAEARVSAADVVGGAGASSGLAAVRYRWNTPVNAACTDGTATSNGAVLPIPSGRDNILYLCARDRTGRLAQWSGGPYDGMTGCPRSKSVEPISCSASSVGTGSPAVAVRDMPERAVFEVHEALAEIFASYSLETVSPADLRAEVEANGRMVLTVGGSVRELELVPADIRAPGYRRTRTTPRGEEELPAGPVSTFRGRVAGEPDSAVRMLITPELVMGYVELGGERYFVDPAYKFLPGGGVDRLVVYRDADLPGEGGITCAAEETSERARDLLSADLLPGPSSGGGFMAERVSGNAYVVELATDADAEYYALHGSSTNSHILGVINMVNGLYEDAGVTLQVTYQNVFTNASTDPYDSCALYGQWCEVWEEWEMNRTGVHRDQAHLFSAKELYWTGTRMRGAAGFVGSVCVPGRSYSLSTNYREPALVAHEIGHALGAEHLQISIGEAAASTYCPEEDCGQDSCGATYPPQGKVMCGAIQSSVDGLHPESVTDIDLYAAASSCIDVQPPQPYYQSERPWQQNADGVQGTDVAWNYAMGYHFTPQVAAQVTGLGGLFNGTKRVRLFDASTGALLAEADVTSANDWAFAAISPVSVQAGRTYTVAVYLAGSGASYRDNIVNFPRTHGSVRIEGSTYIDTSADPDARPTNVFPRRMYGQADVEIVPTP